MIYLIESHTIKPTNPHYKELDNICFLSKNLYNAANYIIKQHYLETKTFLNKFELINKFTREYQPDYKSLPAKIAQLTIYQLYQNWSSFFGLLKAKKDKTYTHKVKTPNYLEKNGRNICTFNNQSYSKKFIKVGLVVLSGLPNFKLKTLIENPLENIVEIKIIPRGNHIKVNIAYKIQEKQVKETSEKIAGLDLGLNNLATIGSNCSLPIIINGRPLKSINQFYNKKLAKLKSEKDISKNKKYNTKKIRNLIFKRNNKVNNYLHKASRLITNYLISNSIDTLVIGLNKGWKQGIEIGHRNNQKFVEIPHSRLIELIKYKCILEGIKVIIREESYTSKCSFIDNEEIKKHKTYVGQRIKRGLFKCSSGRLINADLNGALNIARKEFPNAFIGYGIEVCSTPKVINLL